jgi:amino acid transporter
VGNIVGSEVFALPAAMGSAARPALIIAVILTGIVTTFLTIAMQSLERRFLWT